MYIYRSPGTTCTRINRVNVPSDVPKPIEPPSGPKATDTTDDIATRIGSCAGCRTNNSSWPMTANTSSWDITKPFAAIPNWSSSRYSPSISLSFTSRPPSSSAKTSSDATPTPTTRSLKNCFQSGPSSFPGIRESLVHQRRQIPYLTWIGKCTCRSTHRLSFVFFVFVGHRRF